MASRRQLHRIDVHTGRARSLLQGCELPARPTALAVDRDHLWVGLFGIERNLLQIDPGRPCAWIAHVLPSGAQALVADPDAGLLAVGRAGLAQWAPEAPTPVVLDERARSDVAYDPARGSVWTAMPGGLLELTQNGASRRVPLPSTPSAVSVSAHGVFAAAGTRLYRARIQDDEVRVSTVHSNAERLRVATRVGPWVVQARPGALSRVSLDGSGARAWPLPGREVTALAPWDDHTVVIGTALGGPVVMDLRTGRQQELWNDVQSVLALLPDQGSLWVAGDDGLYRFDGLGEGARARRVHPGRFDVMARLPGGIVAARGGHVVRLDTEGSRTETTRIEARVQAMTARGRELWVGTDRGTFVAPGGRLARMRPASGRAPRGSVLHAHWRGDVLWALVDAPLRWEAWRRHPLVPAWGPTRRLPLPASTEAAVVQDPEHLVVVTSRSTAVVPAVPPPWRAADVAPLGLLGVAGIAIVGLAWRRRPAVPDLDPAQLSSTTGEALLAALRALDGRGRLDDALRQLGLPLGRADRVRALLGAGTWQVATLEGLASLLEADVLERAENAGGCGLRLALPGAGRAALELVLLAPDVAVLEREGPRARTDLLRQLVERLGIEEGDVHTARLVVGRGADRLRAWSPDPAAGRLGVRHFGLLLLSADPASSLAGLLVRQGLARHLSPYATTGAVKSPEMFYGRAAALRWLLAEAHPAVLLVGPRRVGKSSMLAQLQRLLDTRPGRVVRLHLQGIERADDLAILLEREDGAPIGRRSVEQVLLAWLDAAPVVLLLDEVDAIVAGADGEALVGLFRRLAADRPLGVVLSGYLELYRAALDRRASAYNFAEVLELGPLDRDAALDLATEPLARLGMRWADESLAQRLVHLAGAYPYVVQLLCDEALRQATDETGPWLTGAHLEAACASQRVRDDFVWFVFRATSPRTRWVCLRFCDDEELERAVLRETAQEELGPYELDVDEALRPLLLFGYVRRRAEDRWAWCVPLFCELVRSDPGRERTIADVISEIRTSPGAR